MSEVKASHKETKKDTVKKVVKSATFIPGACNARRIIGDYDLTEKFKAGEIVELPLSIVNGLKKYGWCELYKEVKDG